jgi:predicted acetyltransferase
MRMQRLEKNIEYLLRHYKRGDEVRLAEIYSECFGPTTPRGIKRWKRRAKILSEHMFIGEVKGKPVSSVVLEFKKLHLGEGVYLKTGGIAAVCTDSDYRRKGIVTNLMKHALNFTKQSGVSNSALFTDLDIPAHRIYSRLGFVDIATRATQARKNSKKEASWLGKIRCYSTQRHRHSMFQIQARTLSNTQEAAENSRYNVLNRRSNLHKNRLWSN